MAIMETIRKRIQANERIIQELQRFQRLTSQSKYKETLLCQIQNQKENDSAAKFTHASLVICLQSIAGTMGRKQSSLTEIILKYNMKFILNNKGIISADILAIGTYLLVKGFIGAEESALIVSIVTITLGAKPAMMLGARVFRKK